MSDIEVIDMGGFSIDGIDGVKKKEPEKKPEPPEKKHEPIPKFKLPTQRKQYNKEPEDPKRHQEHVLMLSRYENSPRFGEYLKSLKFNLQIQHLKKLSIAELEDLLQRVRISIANRTVSDVWTNSIFTGIKVVESVSAVTRLNNFVKLSGLSEALESDDSFLDILEELKLNNQNLAYVSIETRLLYTILSTVAQVNAMNGMLERHNTKKEAKHKLSPVAEEPSVSISTSEKIIDISE